MPTRSRQPQRLTRFQAFKLWFRDNLWWGALGGVLAVVGLVLGGIQIFFPEALRPEPSERALGTTAKVGPVSITPHSVECGKGLDSLPREFQADIKKQQAANPGLRFPKGQLCLCPVRVRNDSRDVVPLPRIAAVMMVGEDRYTLLLGDAGVNTLALFPHEALEVKFSFDIPATAAPTHVQFTDEVDGDEVKYVVN